VNWSASSSRDSRYSLRKPWRDKRRSGCASTTSSSRSASHSISRWSTRSCSRRWRWLRLSRGTLWRGRGRGGCKWNSRNSTFSSTGRWKERQIWFWTRAAAHTLIPLALSSRTYLGALKTLCSMRDSRTSVMRFPSPLRLIPERWSQLSLKGSIAPFISPQAAQKSFQVYWTKIWLVRESVLRRAQGNLSSPPAQGRNINSTKTVKSPEKNDFLI